MPTKTKNRTVKQQAWIEAMLTGCNPTEAAVLAVYAPGTESQRGYENVRNSELMLEIDSRKAQLASQTDYTVAKAQKEYEEARLLAMRIGQPAAASTAVTGKARLFGMDKDAGGGEKTVIIISPKAPKQVKSAVIEQEDG
jgi:hypothetical protein